MLKRKVPLYYLIASIVITAVVSYLIFFQTDKANNKNAAYTVNVNQGFCSYNLIRLKGFDYINPLMYAEPNCESPSLDLIKADIEKIINTNKSTGALTSASVYVREFLGGEWISAGDEKQYSPGSLMKVPALIAYCKMKENDPKLFDKRITNNQTSTVKNIHFVSKSIEFGKTYTVRELLRYMISYSDNIATTLLMLNVDQRVYDKVFIDLGMHAMDPSKNEYRMTAKEFSRFFKILYSAGYLSNEDSEFCLELLSNCDYKGGIVAGLPANSKVVHKFGEGGAENNPCFNESGIIYLDNNAYVLTVMTNGTDLKILPDIVRQISQVVYGKMLNYRNSVSRMSY